MDSSTITYAGAFIRFSIMKFYGGKIFDQSFKPTFVIVRLSGYIFYSIENIANNKLKLKRNLSDYGMFVASLIFSILVFFYAGKQSFNPNLKSKIMSTGVIILFKFLVIITLTIKIHNFIKPEESFNIFAAFHAMEVKVRLKFESKFLVYEYF